MLLCEINDLHVVVLALTRCSCYHISLGPAGMNLSVFSGIVCINCTQGMLQ